MTKKILLDVDPGIDDAVALCLALFDPQYEVVAVTAVGGECLARAVNAQRAGDHRAVGPAALAADRRGVDARYGAAAAATCSCTAPTAWGTRGSRSLNCSIATQPKK